MATVNGWTNHDGQDTISVNHLGKRKRSESPAKPKTNGVPDFSDVLQLLRKHDTSPSILEFPLASQHNDEPRTKKTRLNHDESDTLTIESRLTAGTYSSVAEIIHDINSTHRIILQGLTSSPPDVVARPSALSIDSFRQKSQNLIETLSNFALEPYVNRKEDGIRSDSKNAKLEETTEQGVGEILTLRSQTDRGPQQLFSGLRGEANAADSSQDDVFRTMPNGFDVTQPLFTHAGVMIPTKDTRTFGEVFRTHRNAKPLEAPFVSKQVSRSRKLYFTQDLLLDQITPVYKNDYNFTSLATGTWLQYGENQQSKMRTMSRSSRDTPAPPADFEAALLANQVLPQKDEDMSALFKMVYSSFAPSCDNSEAIITDHDRSRKWWNKYGDRRMQAIFGTRIAPEIPDSEAVIDGEQDEFADLVANFQPIEETATNQSDHDVDDMLEEVSDLIQTLHSYQKIHSLKPMTNTGISKPDSNEQQVYDLLRSQLVTLINSLPPFAVAKLNGDVLDELNISTNIMVQRPDFRGTGQIDEFTLRRTRAAQSGAGGGTRTAAPINQRASYQTPAPNQIANSQARAYNSSVATNNYTPRHSYVQPAPTTVPRPTQGRPPYQSNTPSYSTQSNHQQYQQGPVQNGYGNHAGTPVPQNYTQQPSQPGYQQRAQAHAAALAHGGTAPTPKPRPVNYPPRNYSPNVAHSPTRSNVPPGQQMQQQASGGPGQTVVAQHAQPATPNASNTPGAVDQIQPRPRAVVGQ